MISEPKAHWTWYDYKLECVGVLHKAGLRMEVEKDRKGMIKIFSIDGRMIFACYKDMGWQNFYIHHLRNVVEKNY